MLFKKIITILIAFCFLSMTSCAKPASKLDRQTLSQATNLAGEWFINQQNNNFLYYEYYPASNTHSPLNQTVRELASLWAITHLAKFTGDPRYQKLSERGFKYFERFIYEDKQNNVFYLKFGEDKINLGASAFMILALVNSDQNNRTEFINKLADGIIFQQNENGSLRPHFYSDDNSNQDYYPGEALLALITLYEQDPQPKYLETVNQAFLYYRDYWNKNPNTPMVPWHSRTYYQLYQHTPKQDIADFIFDMNDYILQDYNQRDNCQKFDFEQGSVIAVHLEGIVKAYALAQELGDQTRQQCYQNFIDQGFAYLVSLQVQPNENLPPAAIGGIWDGPDHQSQRVDRNQHAVMALMDYLAVKKE